MGRLSDRDVDFETGSGDRTRAMLNAVLACASDLAASGNWSSCAKMLRDVSAGLSAAVAGDKIALAASLRHAFDFGGDDDS